MPKELTYFVRDRKPVLRWMLLAIALLCSPAFAQVSGEAFNGFRGNSKDPVQIDADKLKVVDGNAQAVFSGNVKVRQGPSLITTSKLVVDYLKGKEGGQGDIKKMTMSGGVIVTSGENTITADKGIYVVATEDVVLTGNVVVSQGSNVAKGEKLVANLKSNIATLSGGRVGTVFTPGQNKSN